MTEPGKAAGIIDVVRRAGSSTMLQAAEPIVRGTILLAGGWCVDVDAGAPAAMAGIYIDGWHAFDVPTGGARPDVAAALGNPAYTSCGFEAIIPTARLASGSHRVHIALHDTRTGRIAPIEGGFEIIIVSDGAQLPDLPFTIRPMLGAVDAAVQAAEIDAVRDGAVAIAFGSGVDLTGWACEGPESTPFAEIFAIVDDAVTVRGETNVNRPDVAAKLETAASGAVGFSVALPSSALRRGPHRVAFAGVTADGELVRFPFILSVAVSRNRSRYPRVEGRATAGIDDVVRLSDGAVLEPGMTIPAGDTVFVRGWAVDADSRMPAGGVIMVLDESDELATIYGFARPDIARQLGDDAYIACGFLFELPTSAMKVGPHTLTCRVLASDRSGSIETDQSIAFIRA